MLTFRCSQCGYQRNVQRSLLGRKAQCPRCKSITTIDEPASVAAMTEDPEIDNWLSELNEANEDPSPSIPDLDTESDTEYGTSSIPVPPGEGLPAPRSFITTALITGLIFGGGMGLFCSIRSDIGSGILTGLVVGPIFGIAMASFVSGRQVVIHFSSRKRFLKELKRAFAEIDYQLKDANQQVFSFKHQQGGFFTDIHVHVGQREALCVGPRCFVKKCMKVLENDHRIDWSGKQMNEPHGETTEDRVANAVWCVFVVGLLLVSLSLKWGNSPEAKAQRYVLSRLKSPSSAVFHSTNVVRKDENGTLVEVVFEAPNSFGVKLRDSMTVLVLKDGTTIER